jgi:hypothetical protein
VSEGGKSDKFDTYLSHALEPSTGAEDSRQQKVSGRLKRADDSAKYMQICLATGIKKGTRSSFRCHFFLVIFIVSFVYLNVVFCDCL